VWRSLDHYVANMKEGQKQIYFLAGESLEAVERSPFLERLKQKGLEVLFLVDPIDEYVVQNLPEFAGKRLQSIAKEGMQLPADEEGKEKRLEEAYKEAFKPLTGFLKTLYGDKVEKVTVSNRLAETPCVLVTSQFGYSANMERILRSQAFADPSRAALMHAKKIMEVNPRHPIIAELLARVKRDPEDGDAKEMGAILYDSSLLYSGFSLEDTAGYSARIFKLVNTGLLGSKASLELLPEMELPPEEAPEDKEEEGEAPADAGEEEL
jgi:HSP90 family molecular chaperone